jgi:putative ATPase
MTEVRRRVALRDGVLLEIVRGDVTLESTDAIVNPANERLQLGGGVAGAILRLGGEIIQRECDALAPVPTGGAVATGAGALAAAFVIHAVGPIWHGGDRGEDTLLASAVESALQVACGLRLRSIAVPAISSGIFGFPKRRAVEILIGTIRTFIIRESCTLQLVRCTNIDEETTGICCDVLAQRTWR